MEQSFNNETEEALEGIGLSKNEVKVYLALLDLGHSTAGSISEMAKIHRTNVYDALERLIEKGLVTYIIEEKTRFFDAVNPNRLYDILKEREVKLKGILPQLLLTRKFAKEHGKVNVYEGVNVFYSILETFLTLKEPIYSVGIPPEAPKMMGPIINEFHKKRIKSKIHMYHIYNDDARERCLEINKLKFTEARSLPNVFASPMSINICKDHVVLVPWTHHALIIKIKNSEIADAFHQYFKILWNTAKKC
jgi:sugar-specific transcriptional regulator TrmB